jgi:hypothetical protein
MSLRVGLREQAAAKMTSLARQHAFGEHMLAVYTPNILFEPHSRCPRTSPTICHSISYKSFFCRRCGTQFLWSMIGSCCHAALAGLWVSHWPTNMTMGKQLRGKRESGSKKGSAVLQNPGNASMTCASIVKEPQHWGEKTNKQKWLECVRLLHCR